jgi:hypothetical protein
MGTIKTFAGRLAVVVAAAVAGLTALTIPQTPAYAIGDAGWGPGPYIIAVDYEHSGYEGYALIRFHTTTGCTATLSDWDSSGPSIPSGWNDEISSFEVFGGGSGLTICLAVHYQNTGYAGDSHGPSTSQTYIGDTMNDETSTERWS